MNYFTVSRTSNLTISSDVHKHGGRSLKWTWQRGDTLNLDLYHDPVKKKQLGRGGIKVWLYLVRSIPGKMTLSFYTSFLAYYRRTQGPECQFDISLDFYGWRGIWVAFGECRLRQTMSPFYRMELRAPRKHDGEIYIDLLRIVRKKIRRQSRDHIVPPIRGRTSTPKDFWQQTYRWSLVKPKDDIFNEIELNNEQLEELRDMRLIRARLRDWFCDGGKATYDLTGYFRSRWSQIKGTIKLARQYFKTLNITRTKGFIRGPPLFARNSEYGQLNISSPELKFGFVMREILFPLSLEYFFLTRKQEIQRTLEEELHKLNDPKLSAKTVQRLFGYDKELMGTFYESSKLRIKPLTKRKLRLALKDVNHYRFLRLLRLLEHILDQGWAVGSAIGSLDHEMNRSSKGFVTSVFLLRKPLQRAGKLARLVHIMKWYLEFGELYQGQFEYKGTTADRMRTLLFYRLMCVLVMPEATLQQAFDKLRDMKALRGWYENALSVNPALGGVIKPDYIGYHHKSFYVKDYCLPAFLTASHVLYLLRGTRFQVNEASRRNLINAINLMRIVSVKYSIPSSVQNTDPNHAKPDLICLMPAFAHVALFEDRSRDGKPKLHEMSSQAIASLRAFLRLFNESDANVRIYLSYGVGCPSKATIMTTLGSLSLMYKLKSLAKDIGIEAEQSPVGNWAKNFAALAIHRRDNWAVTVKGFNSFVWGYEASYRGNHYGRYQSHGQLIIGNSDHALKAYDIRQGWDWTRLPGTTTLRVSLKQLINKVSRFYNPKDLCGAVSFQGTSRLRNGVFIMDFQRPNYEQQYGRGSQDNKFWFKKSVFFNDELLVCLGSDINARLPSHVEAETTLFQNIGTIEDQIHSIFVNGFELQVKQTENSKRFVWGKSSPAILIDINGNGYYVPRAGTQHLTVRIGNQTSYSSKLMNAKTEGHYATAWLNHGANPQGKTYEYAILINTSFKKLYNFACRQEKLRGLPKYEVLRQDKHAHVVKFNNAPRIGLTTYGYSIFRKNVILPGPLILVSDPCVAMVEDGRGKSQRFVIGVSYPQLNFNTTKKLRTTKDVKDEELFYMRSQEKRVWVLLKYKVKPSSYRVYVDGELVDPKEANEHVRVIPTYPDTNIGSLVYFMKLFNGFTTEVHFRRIPKVMVEA